MPAPPLRIAILECDTPLEATRSRYGGYGGVFTALLHSAAQTLSPALAVSDLDLSSFDTVTRQEYPSLDAIDAILISGSRHDAFSDEPWTVKLVEFVKEVLAQKRVRIIGVCFGHQIVGRALGAKVGRGDKGWEVSVTALDLTKKGQELFGKTALAIHQMHRDIVFSYPEGVEPLAYNEKCEVQAMCAPQRLISVQGHPEFNEEIMREILSARHASGVFDDETFKDAMGRVDRYQDGVVVAAAFLKFLLD